MSRQAAYAAGETIKEAFNKEKSISEKGTSVDLVTETDKQCEETIVSMLKEAFPSHKFIGEEDSAAQGGASQLTDDPTWIIDPIDGTTNFVHQYPFVGVSIGLAVAKELVLGVVYNPILEEMFTATKGGGAFLNSSPIKVSSTTELNKALVATELGVARDDVSHNAAVARFSELSRVTRSIRCCGSCALNMCGVACGRLDGFYEIGYGGPWDAAGGAVIVREAGGVVIDPSGPQGVGRKRAVCCCGR